ncbi:MAG: YveK family protein [Turicibacter sanguinis]
MEEMQYQEMTLEDIFRALKKRWLLIVSVTLMCLIGGSIFVLFFGPEPVYQASTTVLVNYRAEETNKLTQSDLTTSQKLVATYTEIIKSATILEPVIKALDLEITADELLKNIGVAQLNDTEIIKITVKNEDAELSRDIANTIANVFSKEISKIMKVDSTSTLDVAKTPMTPLSQNKITKIAIAGILGMMISAGLVFVLEYLDRTVKTADETEKLLGVPVLGVIQKSKDLA